MDEGHIVRQSNRIGQNRSDDMNKQNVVTADEWLTARQELLRREKEFTRSRDELSKARREMPWHKVTSDYVFDGPDGSETLTDLFGGKSQLIIYHFMFGPEWQEGCPSCSFWADNFDHIDVHLDQRDIAFLAVSRASLSILDAYKQRMGWRFKWVSSFGNSFNFDYQASFTPDAMKNGSVYYNYHETQFPSEEAPGISVFFRDDRGDIYHTYSCYARGLDMLNGAYHYMDLTPKGRDEDELAYPMAWVCRHDQY